MDENFAFYENGTDEENTLDPSVLATRYLMYKIGEGINKVYLPVIIPIGVVGNILSFLVMIQPHNRRTSFSLYISSLAVSDTIVLLCGLSRYLNMVLGINMLPDQYWRCALCISIVFMTSMCSTFFILSMTFERFYSIIRPHKAASFNTIKRAKITILSVTLLSILLGIPHLFMSTFSGRICYSNVIGFDEFYGQFYYWGTSFLQFFMPFVLLLCMNSVIIHTLRKRPILNKKIIHVQNQGQGHNEGQINQIKNSERQIYIMLLLVTFGFLISVTPIYIMAFYILAVEGDSPQFYAGYHLFYHAAEKALYTNYAINFYLYVISGKKFRADLVQLFQLKRNNCGGTSVSDILSEGNTTTQGI